MDMDLGLGFITGLFIGIMLGIIFFVIMIGSIEPYKQGQIDAINGNIKYELVVQPDKSTEWVKIEKGK